MNKKLLIFSIFVFLALSSIFYFFKLYKSDKYKNSNKIENLQLLEIPDNPIIYKDVNMEIKEWTLYKNEKFNFEFKYPNDEKTKIKANSLFEAKSVSELKKEEKTYSEQGLDIFGVVSVGEQVDMLRNGTDCRMNDELKNKFLGKEFKLFYGKGGPLQVDLLYNNNLKKCAIRFIGSDGLDVSLDNFSYILAFIDGESIYFMRTSFYKIGIFDFVDLKLREIGYESSGGVVSCDSQCGKKEIEYFNYLSKNVLNDPMIKKISEIYDQLFLTFKFLK
ncbi:MAG: hypothetical protein A2W83_03670 [Sulfuricurvum sp. RIFCSPLOWO2_12_43_5]|nr:MAG: hypothetical protein A2W83_03670 [Sulfuricurvum sp. RIFCSPLOWO2_12_43_5]